MVWHHPKVTVHRWFDIAFNSELQNEQSARLHEAFLERAQVEGKDQGSRLPLSRECREGLASVLVRVCVYWEDQVTSSPPMTLMIPSIGGKVTCLVIFARGRGRKRNKMGQRVDQGVTASQPGSLISALEVQLQDFLVVPDFTDSCGIPRLVEYFSILTSPPVGFKKAKC